MKEINTKIVFVSDYFVEDMKGGAEMSNKVLIDASPFDIIKMQSFDVNPHTITQFKDCFWIITNFTKISYYHLPCIIENLRYALIEYDFKYCTYRSPARHKFLEGAPCDCEKKFGQTIIPLFLNAKRRFWMSQKQHMVYRDRFAEMHDTTNDRILSSIFSEQTLDKIEAMAQQKVPKNNEWIITGSTSWVKGAENAEAYCKEHGLTYKTIHGISYDQMLRILAESEGLVYLPAGEDTCPRLVIEAQLLNCKLRLNNYVQHKDEGWFNASHDRVISYLRTRSWFFWHEIKHVLEEIYA